MGVEFVQISLPPILIGILASIACALPGNFLILKRQALIGDAISHVILPGIVVAFLIVGSTSSWPMILGAATAAIIAVILIEFIRHYGRIEQSAAMGVVFTSLFAFGVLLLEQTNTANVHLDVEHALFGNLESLIWFEATGWESLINFAHLSALPDEFWRMAITALILLIAIILFWRNLKIISFDETFAQALNIPVRSYSFGIIIASAIAAVAAFDAVGSIIVIAMFICPPASARLLTNKLSSQLLLSVLIATLSALLGYVFAGYGPIWLGFDNAVSAAGMIATISGIILAICAVAGPHRHARNQ